MHKKHTDQQVYSSSEVPPSHNAKRTKKYEKKEQGNTKQEEPRSNSHKATQNKNKTTQK